MIPAAAVEAAARVLKDSLEAGYVEGEDLTDLLIDVQGFDLLAAMKVALEAAAPHIIATALRKAADELEYGNPINEWLYGRADEIEATK